MIYRRLWSSLALPALLTLACPRSVLAGFLWARSYDGAAGDIDVARAIAVLPDRGVVVTGGTREATLQATTIAYDQDGTPRWTRHYGTSPHDAQGRDVATAADGSIYIAALQWLPTVDSSDIVLIKYDTAGNQEWVRVYDGLGLNDVADFIKVSPSNHILVLGASTRWDGNFHYDFLLLKYTTRGELLWARRFDGPGHFDDYPTGMVIDSADNIYITGYVDNTPGPLYDWATLKYSPDGVLEWSRLYNGSGDDNDYPNGLALSPDESALYVTGRIVLADPYMASAITTIKYDDRGNEIWKREYREGLGDQGMQVAVDSRGDVFVTGHIEWSDCITLSYTAEGALRWAHRYDGPSHNQDVGYNILLSSHGTLFVVGLANRALSPWRGDVLVLTYSDTGVLLGESIYDGPTHNFDGSSGSVAVGGTVYVSGLTARTQEVFSFDYLTLKHAEDVVPVILTSFEFELSTETVTLFWRTGGARGGELLFDVERREVEDPDSQRINVAPIAHEVGDALAFRYNDSSAIRGAIYEYRLVATYRSGERETFPPLRVAVSGLVASAVVTILQSVPNPVSDATTISFETSAAGRVQLDIYDAMGRPIRRLVDATRKAGYHSVTWNADDDSGQPQASGVYFACLRANGTAVTRKLLIVR